MNEPVNYTYETEKENLFSDEGQRIFLEIRDRVDRALSIAGAVRMDYAIRGSAGMSWTLMACVDRMVELGELKEITDSDTMGQFRVFSRYPKP
jgi:hypothetical protein